jgi:hypothetical protein
MKIHSSIYLLGAHEPKFEQTPAFDKTADRKKIALRPSSGS